MHVLTRSSAGNVFCSTCNCTPIINDAMIIFYIFFPTGVPWDSLQSSYSI